jgi:Mg-chelatase subunit ChlD
MQNAVKATTLFLVALLVTANLSAQEGTSSMSMSIGRAGVGSRTHNGGFRMPTPDMFRIEEMINYHRHDIPLPTGAHRVKLDIQSTQLESGKTVLQFGLATPHDVDPELVRPLNLVLVIDQSGSMSGKRINDVQNAIHAMVQRLRRTDRVTIVGFNGTARVHLEASDKTKANKIRKAIERIRADGGTNLHAGLMLGYRQAQANFDEQRTNRVILLTDGRTNTGQIDLATIARESKAYNKAGIELSTIGLGSDLNHDLLRELADAGRGLIHFVDDEKDIEKTFVAEVESLLSPAASKVKLTIDLGDFADQAKFYGYTPVRRGNQWVFKLDNLNHGATQVIMAKLPKDFANNVTASLRYKDSIHSEMVDQEVSLASDEDSVSRGDSKRNYAIAVVADSIQRAAQFSNEGECEKAANRLRKGVKTALRLVGHGEDENVNRINKIASDYESQIRESLSVADRR